MTTNLLNSSWNTAHLFSLVPALALAASVPHTATAFSTPPIIKNRYRNHGNIFSGNTVQATIVTPEVTTVKTSKEEDFILESLQKKALFQNLPDETEDKLIDAFEKFTALPGDIICEQGDPNMDDYYVYLVGEGSQCTATVDGVQSPVAIKGGQIFGELGVFYNKPRAATVSAKSPPTGATIYRIYGETFLDLLNKPTETLVSMKEIDAAINQVIGTEPLYGGDIIPTYQPERVWLWQQYSGTVLKISIKATLFNMLACVVFIFYAKYVTGDPFFMGENISSMTTETFVTNKEDFMERLSAIDQIWSYQRNLTIFVLTFFLNQAYAFWSHVYDLGRQIQGRLNDYHLLLATNVKRNPDGTLPDESEELLDDVGEYSRLFHILMWASVAKRFSMLLIGWKAGVLLPCHN